MKDLFPFEIAAHDNGNFIDQPPFRKTFRDGKPDDVTWYAFDIKVSSWSECEFTVFGMRDSCYGGIGMACGSFTCVPNEDEIKAYIVRRLYRMAVAEEEREVREARAKRVEEIRNQLMIEYGL